MLIVGMLLEYTGSRMRKGWCNLSKNYGFLDADEREMVT